MDGVNPQKERRGKEGRSMQKDKKYTERKDDTRILNPLHMHTAI